MLPRSLHTLQAVVFDLDGTLTHSGHDFAAMKGELGLPPGLPLMEGLLMAPVTAQPALWARIEAWEEALADRSEPDPGAHRLLSGLAAKGVAVGVLTRNTAATALRSLAVAGLAEHFAPERVLGRHDAPPKPHPAGLRALLARVGATPGASVMVGDAPHDTDTGLRVGAFAVAVDPGQRPGFERVHLAVRDLGELAAYWSL